MAVKISCTTKHSEDPIVWKLLENSFTERFLAKLRWVKNIYNFESSNDYMPLVVLKWDQTTISEFEQSLKESVEWLNENGFCFPLQAKDIEINNDQPSRELLNKLHRYFTTSHRTITHGERVLLWQDNTDLVIPYDATNNSNLYSRFNTEIHNINTRVHELENYFFTPNMKLVPRFAEQCLTYISTNPIDSNFNPQDQFYTPIQENDYQYFSDNTLDYDVWLPLGEIQGKNYYRAFFDMDQPNHWDVFTNHYYSGSFCFADRGHMKNEHIVSWLQKYGIEANALTVGVPLGHVVANKELLSKFDINDITKVDIIE